MAFKSAYPTVRLGDVVQFVNGDRGSNYPKEQDYRAVGVPFISAVDIATGTLDFASTKRISPEAYRRLRNGKVQPGDLLYCLRGSIGKSALVRNRGEGAIASSLVIIRGSEHAGTRFVQYVLNSPIGQSLALRLNNGSVQPNISVRDLREIEFPLPPIAGQQDILASLGSIDDRIHNLCQTNATLAAIAQALFKSWFVDFDPVRAKAEGREPKDMDAATAALFPSEFQDSDLGPIPRGWRVGTLADLVELKYGKALKASVRREGSIPVYGSGGITGQHDAFLVPGPTVIVGRKGTVGILYWESGPCFPIDTVFYVAPKGSLHFSYYAMQRMGLEHLNTDAAVPGLNRDNAYRQPTIIPPRGLMDAWDALASAIRHGMDHGNQRIQTLHALRDTLLPRLISGKLRLPEARDVLGEATP